MKLVDLIILAIVLGGIGLMLYKTMWKQKTLCPGCDGCSASTKKSDDAVSCSSGCCK